MVEKYTSDLFYQRREWTESCINNLNSKKDCDIYNLFDNFKFIQDKGSQSNSILFEGNLKNDPSPELNNTIITKAYFPNSNILKNNLTVEKQVYENVLSCLFKNNITPCIMDYLGYYVCDTELLENALPSNELKTFLELKRELYNTNQLELNLLFLNKSKGLKLNKWIDKDKNLDDILSVIFQIFYTLKCFNNLTLRHNDLHFGNIFIETLDNPIVMYFKIGINYVKLRTKYLVKIYDFDRAGIYHPAVERNLYVDTEFCKKYGQCHFPDSKNDLFAVISNLHYTYGNKLQDSIKKEIKNKLVIKIVNWYWYVEHLKTHPEWYWFIPNDVKITDDEIKSIDYSLNTLLSTSWSVSPFEVLDKIPDNVPENIIFSLPPIKTIPIMRIISSRNNTLINKTKLKEIKSSTIISENFDYIKKIWSDEIQHIQNSKFAVSEGLNNNSASGGLNNITNIKDLESFLTTIVEKRK